MMKLFQVKCRYFVELCFAILFICQFASVLAVGIAPSSNNQLSNNRIPLPRRASSSSSSSSTGRSSRNYMTTFIKRVRPRIRYSSTTGSRSRGKPNDPRYAVSSRNTTRSSENGKSTGRYYQYSSAQKSYYTIRTINKQYKTMRIEHRRYARDIERAKSEVNHLRQKCDAYERNATSTLLLLQRQKREFQNYQKETMNKIRQIETHQQSQDLQYFEVFEATTNNTAEISHLQSVMDNFQDMYGDVGDMTELMPGEDNWNQQLAAQDVQLRYESFGVDDGTAEEIIERSYHRMTESLQPQLDDQSSKLDEMQETLQRQSERLEFTNSAMSEYNSALQSTLTVQDDLSKNMEKLNQTLQLFHGDLKTTEERVLRMEMESQSQMLAYSDLQSTVAKINASLPRRHRNRKPAALLSNTAQQINGIEAQTIHERIEDVSFTLEEEKEKMANLSRSVQSVDNEIRYLTMATSNFYAILTKQAKVIHQQNVTMTPVLAKIEQQENRIMDLESDLSYYHETVMKLLNIVTNLGRQIRRPIPPHKDCHDLWMSGHTEDGIYTVVHEMETKQLYCNMTDNGGWTVVQRRNDGSQDFDRNFEEYKKGFGNIYGEFWLGLDSLKWLTNGRIYTLMVILEDWGGNRRYAFYDQFCVFGNDYALKVSGYKGNAGDSLSQSNQQTFKVRHFASSFMRTPTSDCTITHKAGWWFSPLCGLANPNGPYSRMANQSVNFDVMDDEIVTTDEVKYMAWRGEDFPLKKVLMQIAPREAVDDEIFQYFSSNEIVETQNPAAENVEFPPPPFEVISSSNGK